MTTLTVALKDLVAGCAGITARIGTNPMRFYPVRLPEPPIVYPAITYQYIDATGVYSHSGYSNVQDPRIQLTIWSQTYADGAAIAKAIRAEYPVGLNAFKGTQSGVKIDHIFIVSGITDYEPTTKIHMRTLDLLMSYVDS
jgi:hypothetical protein